jgi:hypothetical protein
MTKYISLERITPVDLSTTVEQISQAMQQQYTIQCSKVYQSVQQSAAWPSSNDVVLVYVVQAT